MRRSEPKTSVHSSKGRLQISGDQNGTPLLALAEDLEEQVRAGGGQGHVAQFVDDQQAEAGQILLQVEQRYLIPGFHRSALRRFHRRDASARFHSRGSSAKGSHEKRRAGDRAITGGPPQPVVASPVTHRPWPDLTHPSNTTKGSLGKRPADSVT